MGRKLNYVQISKAVLLSMLDDKTNAEIANAMRALAAYVLDGTEADLKDRMTRELYRHMRGDVERGREYSTQKREAAEARWDKVGNQPEQPEQPMLPGQCGFITDADAAQMARDQSDVIDEAKRSGFRMIPAEEDQLIDLLSRYGKEKVLTALGEAVRHNAASLAYVAKVLEGIRREEARKDDKPPELTQTMKFN